MYKRLRVALENPIPQRFDTKMLSHRAGRWAFDERYARLLIEFGYITDCSVTPGVSWRANPGHPDGQGGSDYRHFPDTPYYLDTEDISRPGTSTLLEIPMTTRRSQLASAFPRAYAIPGVRSVAYRIAPEVHWLRPDGHNLASMRALVKQAVADQRAHLEFMLHSSELMPGGSPTFGATRDIEKLYDDLEVLFRMIAGGFCGETLSGFAKQFQAEDRE